MIALLLAWLVGYAARVAVEMLDWFRPMSTPVSLAVILLILYWVVGRQD